MEMPTKLFDKRSQDPKMLGPFFSELHVRTKADTERTARRLNCCCSSVVERVLGKDEAMGSTPISSC